ncbi:MAG TPA: hypothetical protein VH482_17170 [Thermomicrobiales bacterium]|jgi:hypothetical protein
MAEPHDYADLIVRSLKGEVDELAGIPSGRLDWNGVSAVMALYAGSANEERTAVIEAIGRVIDDDNLAPSIRAEVVDLAANLDISQVEASVLRLEQSSVAEEPVVRDAVTHYLAVRQMGVLLRHHSEALVATRSAGD